MWHHNNRIRVCNPEPPTPSTSTTIGTQQTWSYEAARPKRAASKEDKVIAAVAKLQAETKKLFKDDPHLAELKKARW